MFKPSGAKSLESWPKRYEMPDYPVFFGGDATYQSILNF